MLIWKRFKPPSRFDRIAWDAEQRWLAAGADIRRQVAFAAIFIAVGLIALAAAAIYQMRPLAILLFCCCIGGLGRVVFLIIKFNRIFLAIKTGAGMTAEDAIKERHSRYPE